MKLRCKHFTPVWILPILWGVSFPVSADNLATVDSIANNSVANLAQQHEQGLRDSERDINRQIEKNRYQQLLDKSGQQSHVQSKDGSLSTACLAVNGLQLSGITLLDSHDLKKLTTISQKCISDSNVNTLVRELTQAYLDKGYITARIVFMPLDENRTLRLHAVEGVLEQIENDDQHVSINNIFPGLIGKPLNIRDLDQGLDQLNRLQSNSTTIDILPGKGYGSSVLRLKHQVKSPYRFSIGTDNYGKKASGRYFGRFDFSWDNPSGHSDFLSLHHSRNLDNPSQGHNRTYSGLYFIPYGFWTFSLFGSKTDSASELPLSKAQYSGSSSQIGFRIDRVLSRNQRKINTLSSSLIHKRSRNELLGYRNLDQNLDLSVLDVSLNQLHITDYGVISLNAGIQRGLSILGASRKSERMITEPHFTKFSASAQWQYSFSILQQDFQVSHNLVAQYSRDRLPSLETFDLTDRSAVRGFNKFSLSSDSGWYLHNNLYYPLAYGQLKITPYVGVDTGRIFNRKSQNAWQSAVAASFGLSLRYQRLSGSFSFDRGWFVSSPQRQNESQLLGKISIHF